MITAGLLLRLDCNSAAAADLAHGLAQHGAFTPGVPEGPWLPVAMEAADDAECRALHDWLLTQHGVIQVDVVHVSFGGPTAVDDSPVVSPTLPSTDP